MKSGRDSETEAEPAAVEPEAAGGDEITFLDWDIRMTEMQRIEPDPEDDGLDDLFSVSFSVDGSNANAEVEIMVPDAADIEVVSVGLDTLHDAMVAWADLLQRSKEALRAIVEEERTEERPATQIGRVR